MSDFNQQLSENLTLYCTNSQYDGKDLFSTHREISIARFALSKQAEAYFKGIQILFNLLEHIDEGLEACKDMDEKIRYRTSVMQAISSVETKSQSLIKSAQEVTHLLGEAVSIDVDKAALKSLLLNLPDLVQETITSIAGDASLGSKIAKALNGKISDCMIALRFSDDTLPNNQPGIGISQQQYIDMFNTVPTQPTI